MKILLHGAHTILSATILSGHTKKLSAYQKYSPSLKIATLYYVPNVLTV